MFGGSWQSSPPRRAVDQGAGRASRRASPCGAPGAGVAVAAGQAVAAAQVGAEAPLTLPTQARKALGSQSVGALRATTSHDPSAASATIPTSTPTNAKWGHFKPSRWGQPKPSSSTVRQPKSRLSTRGNTLPIPLQLLEEGNPGLRRSRPGSSGGVIPWCAPGVGRSRPPPGALCGRIRGRGEIEGRTRDTYRRGGGLVQHGSGQTPR